MSENMTPADREKVHAKLDAWLDQVATQPHQTYRLVFERLPMTRRADTGASIVQVLEEASCFSFDVRDARGDR